MVFAHVTRVSANAGLTNLLILFGHLIMKHVTLCVDHFLLSGAQVVAPFLDW